jgi:hypothetical protein
MKYFFDEKKMFDSPDINYEGFFSWKFEQKTKVSVESFLKGIQAHPGYDVYIINPFPSELLYWNVWSQGEYEVTRKI